VFSVLADLAWDLSRREGLLYPAVNVCQDYFAMIAYGTMIL